MSKKIIFIFLAGVMLLGVLVLLLSNIYQPKTTSNKIQVAASFYPLSFFAQQIGGDKADVVNITPAGAEPHDYEPTAQDIAKIETAKMLVLNGDGLEVWGDAIQQNLNQKNTFLVVAGEALADQQLTEDGKTIQDPHIWLSPHLAKIMVDRIALGFIAVDPANKDYYQANENVLMGKLNNLDGAYTQGLENCKQKNIITSHAAFGYMARDYGLVQVSIAGLSPDEEPSPQQLARVVKFARANNVTYIFFESLVSPKLSETIATEVGAKTLVLNPIEGLTNDEISEGQSYFTNMEANLTNLKIALQCQ